MASPQSPSPVTLNPVSVLLHATTALQVNAGSVGSAVGVAGDTAILQVFIPQNGAAITLTIGGFKGEDGTARNVVMTGSTTVDTTYDWDNGIYGAIVNNGGPLVLTASVADKVLVSLRPA